ncbi:MAG TPA: low affinity iron permease family protein [Anaerolineales bacterium]|nr:low affinity iron permease family protein [Anaerolineales bacterium]
MKKKADVQISGFTRFAKAASRATGKPATFIGAALLILLWAITGPIFDFSDTWQLFINTSTTIVTFLMVFLIQNTQNRDTEAMHIKLDELIRAVGTAQNTMLDLEELDEKELDEIRAEYEKLAEKARKKLKSTRSK